MHAAVATDGALGEWTGAPAIVLDPPSVGSDNSATVRLAWDATNLYAAFSVTDASVVVNQGGRDGELWDGDSVELMVDTSAGASSSIGPSALRVSVNARRQPSTVSRSAPPTPWPLISSVVAPAAAACSSARRV